MLKERMAELMMKTSKIPREQNPYFLTGRGKKKLWSFLRWRRRALVQHQAEYARPLQWL
jgi:hypothetical protein